MTDYALNKALQVALSCAVQYGADFLDSLEQQGFTIVPKVIVGASGWSARELHAYQMGIMYARFAKESVENDVIPEL